MSSTALAAFLLVPVAALVLSLNHLLARVGIVELGFSQGQPSTPAPAAAAPTRVDLDRSRAASLLPPEALSLFVSATCVSCARLVDDLAAPGLVLPFDLHLYFADHRSPLARSGEVHEQQAELFADLAVPVTPYAVRTRGGVVVAAGGVPDLAALATLLDWDPAARAVGSPA